MSNWFVIVTLDYHAQDGEPADTDEELYGPFISAESAEWWLDRVEPWFHEGEQRLGCTVTFRTTPTEDPMMILAEVLKEQVEQH